MFFTPGRMSFLCKEMLGPCERHGSDGERQWVKARDRASERGKERG